MGVGQSFAITLDGLEGLVVCVECDVSRGMPGMSVIGMGDAAVIQARDRIRAALTNSGVAWPGQKVVMSLSPAGVPKSGASFDVAMVCAMVAAKVDRPGVHKRLQSTVLVGELGLDGDIRSVPGILPVVMCAAARGFSCVIVPEHSAQEAGIAQGMVDGVDVLLAPHLRDVLSWLDTGSGLMPVGEFLDMLPESSQILGADSDQTQCDVDMAEVSSQPEARRAVEIAAAGGHTLLLMGPPGTGKSMLAQRIPGILPDMRKHEIVEACSIHSIAGSKGQLQRVIRGHRPFVAPHHTVSQAGLIGGGARPVPGAVSLAHHGVLFLDEIPEVSRPVLDTLRVPLEAHRVELTRNRRVVTFPARFQLVCAANPCPCGAEFDDKCTCAAGVRARYQAKLSGPLRDRIHLTARTRSNKLARLDGQSEESSAIIKQRVMAADARARHRWAGVGTNGEGRHTNATVPATVLRRKFPAEEAGMLALQDMLRTGEMSQRGVDKVLRVAWTICDLREGTRPGVGDVLDAVELCTDAVQ